MASENIGDIIQNNIESKCKAEKKVFKIIKVFPKYTDKFKKEKVLWKKL